MLTAIREYLAEQRKAIRHRHEQNEPPLAVANALADLVDEVVRRLYQRALEELAPEARPTVAANLCLVPLGGYGRRDLAPFSDVDLLFLHTGQAADVIAPFTKRLVRDVWDVGLSLGQNVCTVPELLTLTRAEVLPATALLESRYFLGPEPLYQELSNRFEQGLRKGHGRRLYQKILSAIREEQQQFGSTVHLLEPDVKRSAGGLRDLHLLRWLGHALYETADFDRLEERGILAPGEARLLAEAHAFLLRVRTDLHFQAGKALDGLLRAEQLRIAKSWGFKDTPSLLAVEQFMRDYFRHTTAIADITGRFIERTRPRARMQRLTEFLASRTAGPGIRISSRQVTLSKKRRREAAGDLGHALEIADLAATYDVAIDRKTIDALRQGFGGNGNGKPPVPDVLPEPIVRRFMGILSRPAGYSRVVRALHDVGVLERVIPEFEHARCLLQFNAYHKYTVDEHTLVMLEHAEKLGDGDDLLARAYKRIVRKDLLHLAILLHDLGKGFPEDHSELGAKIAEGVTRRLGLSEEDRQTVVFLVLKHLHLSNLAFRRDVNDVRLQVQLTRDLGSAPMLRMLYVLTAVDIMAVGPGTYNQWKADLLAELYVAALRHFGEEESHANARSRAAERREQLLRDHGGDDRLRGFVTALPDDYLVETSPNQIVAHMLQWQLLGPSDVATLTEYHPARNIVTYTVLTHERITEGIFSKIVGALSSHHLDILSARIHTLADGTVIDQFDVADVHHAGEPSAERCKLVGTTIQRVLRGELLVSDILWNSRSSIFGLKQRVVGRGETRIVVDNASSTHCTVIDVFTANRRGLLYTLAKGIYRLGLSVQYAKIATYEDEVVDVFYVQEYDGRKVHRADRAVLVRDHLTADINRLATDPRSMGF